MCRDLIGPGRTTLGIERFAVDEALEVLRKRDAESISDRVRFPSGVFANPRLHAHRRACKFAATPSSAGASCCHGQQPAAAENALQAPSSACRGPSAFAWVRGQRLDAVPATAVPWSMRTCRWLMTRCCTPPRHAAGGADGEAWPVFFAPGSAPGELGAVDGEGRSYLAVPGVRARGHRRSDVQVTPTGAPGAHIVRRPRGVTGPVSSHRGTHRGLRRARGV